MNTGTYALVENGAITAGPCQLPPAWRNVSGFNLMADNAELAKLGWLPVVDETPTRLPGQINDGHTLTVEKSRVVYAEVYRAMTVDEEKQVQNAAVLGEIARLEATITNRRIREAALTQAGKDWLAGVDAQIATLRVGLV